MIPRLSLAPRGSWGSVRLQEGLASQSDVAFAQGHGPTQPNGRDVKREETACLGSQHLMGGLLEGPSPPACVLWGLASSCLLEIGPEVTGTDSALRGQGYVPITLSKARAGIYSRFQD